MKALSVVAHPDIGQRLSFLFFGLALLLVSQPVAVYHLTHSITSAVGSLLPELSIDSFPIKKVSQTRFLGVIIDEDLSWDPHIAATRRKLNYAASSLYRMRDSIPSNLHKDLYHTLYESHLAYCISVWGGASPSKTGCLSISQKQCIRFLFGDKEAFLNKFRTCARARPVKSQLLGEEFYSREHTKPLFNKHKILSFMNLYTYHTYMELFKILKFRDPLVIHEQFKVSNRKSNLLINNFPAKNFVSRSTGMPSR